MAVDPKTKQVLSFKVAGENVHNSKMFIPLLKQIINRIGPNRVRKVLEDTPYDSKPNYNYSEKRGILQTIRPRGNSNPEKKQPLTRKRLVKTIKRYGYKKWAGKAKYGLRWAV